MNYFQKGFGGMQLLTVAAVIYVAGDQSGKQLLWSCGGSGIDAELLPEGCKS